MPNTTDAKSFFFGVSTPITTVVCLVVAVATCGLMVNVFRLGLAAFWWLTATAGLLVWASLDDLSPKEISIGFAVAMVIAGGLCLVL